jgi:hypothetical protein
MTKRSGDGIFGSAISTKEWFRIATVDLLDDLRIGTAEFIQGKVDAVWGGFGLNIEDKLFLGGLVRNARRGIPISDDELLRMHEILRRNEEPLFDLLPHESQGEIRIEEHGQ